MLDEEEESDSIVWWLSSPPGFRRCTVFRVGQHTFPVGG